MQDTSSKFTRVTLPGLDFQLVSHTTMDGRVYTTPEGNIYPSASTISRILTRDGIMAWRERVGEAEANKKTNRGAKRGTLVHTICEKYLLGTLTDMERIGMFPTTKELFLQLKKELDNRIGIVYAVEQALYSDKLRVAGRTDAIVEWDGELAILDFKTSEKPKPLKWIVNYFVQTAAYAVMVEERTGVPVNKLVIAMAVEESNVPVVYIEEKAPYLSILQQCIDTHYTENS